MNKKLLWAVLALVLASGWLAARAQDSPKTAPAQPDASNATFAGKWDTAWGAVELKIDGGAVTGTYPKDGKIEGKLSADGMTLEGTWSQGPDHKAPDNAGRLILMLTDDAKWQGLWWKGPDGKGGTWVGTRSK